MTLWQGLILGVIQGLTEFLPVSSAGHLVIAQHFFGLKESELLFDAMVHLGTLMAVFIVFRDDIVAIGRAVGRGLGRLKSNKGFERETEPDLKLALFIIVGIIPTAVIGIFFKDIFEIAFGSVIWTAVMLMVTGLLLWMAEKIPIGKRGIGEMNILDCLLIGGIQGLAITPGISRSGSTIACGLYRRINRDLAVRYSFLLSIPTILGAALFQLVKCARVKETGPDLATIILGTLAAALVGYFAIKILLRMVKGRRLRVFAYYCWILSLIVLVTQKFF